MCGPCEGWLVCPTPVEAVAAALRAQRDRAEWLPVAPSAAVLAGLVLQLPSLDGNGGFVCVSLGTGTRCVGDDAVSAARGVALRDGHAEVMARRGFLAFLLDAAAHIRRGNDPPHALVAPFRGGRCVALRRGVSVHVVCSARPCGAMAAPLGGGRVLLRVPSGRFWPSEAADGAFGVCRGHRLAAHRGHAADGHRLAARVKPGRGRPSLCMSCSDKLLRWHCLGLQGARRSRLVPEPVRLAAVWLPNADTPDRNREGAAAAINARRKYFAAAGTAPPVAFHWFDPSALPYATGAAESCWSRSAWLTVAPDACGTTSESQRNPTASHRRATTSKKDTDGDDEGDGKNTKMMPIHENEASSNGDGMIGANNERTCAGTKRPRSSSETALLCWTKAATLVLNSKSGIPRGVTRQSMQQAVEQLHAHQNTHSALEEPSLDAIAARFPLSRLWMERRLHALGFESGAALSVPLHITKDGAIAHDGKEELILVGGSVHYWLREGERCNSGDDGDPLLWVEKGFTSAPCQDKEAVTEGAKEG